MVTAFTTVMFGKFNFYIVFLCVSLYFPVRLQKEEIMVRMPFSLTV